MSIIDGLVDTYTDFKRFFNIPKFSTINRAGKLIEAGLLENDDILNKINSNKQQIETLKRKAKSYSRRASSCLNTQRQSKNEIKKLRRALKDLRKNYREDHRFWGTVFFIPSVIPLVGDVFKRGLCIATSPDYRRLRDQIAEENEAITDAIIKQRDILDEIDEIKVQIEDKEEENASLADYINDLYEDNAHRIPTILYIKDNLETFQKAHEQGIISDRFMNTIIEYQSKMQNGEELPENINESEFLAVLKDYKSVFESFKRNRDQTMLKDPDFLIDNHTAENEQINNGDENRQPDEEENIQDNNAKQDFRARQDCKVYLRNGINATAFQQTVEEAGLTKYNIDPLIILGAMEGMTKEDYKNFVNRMNREGEPLFGDEVLNNVDHYMNRGAAVFKDVEDKVANGNEADIEKDYARVYIKNVLLKRYNEIIEDFKQQNTNNSKNNGNIIKDDEEAAI